MLTKQNKLLNLFFVAKLMLTKQNKLVNLYPQIT